MSQHVSHKNSPSWQTINFLNLPQARGRQVRHDHGVPLPVLEATAAQGKAQMYGSGIQSQDSFSKLLAAASS